MNEEEDSLRVELDELRNLARELARYLDEGEHLYYGGHLAEADAALKRAHEMGLLDD